MQDIGPVFSEHAHKPDRINDRTQTVQSRNTPEQIVQLSAEVCTVICVHRDIRLAPVKLSRGIRPDIRTVFSKRLGYAQHDPSGAPAPCHVYLGYIHDATLSVSDPVNTIGAMIQILFSRFCRALVRPQAPMLRIGPARCAAGCPGFARAACGRPPAQFYS